MILPADRLGPLLARCRLHRLEHRQLPDGRRVVAKRRRWFAPLLIPLGNLYLRWLGAGVIVLGDRAWRGRERVVHRHLHGIGCTTDPRGWLVLPEWPGSTLADFAADPVRAPAERLGALAAAARALEELHRVRIARPGGPAPGLTHGDATLRNVRYDPASRRAYWFDFDTAHRPEVAAEARRADDLHVLLYSAAAVLADVDLAHVYSAVRGAYRDPIPWRHLREQLRRGPLHSSPFHFAQARPTAERQCRLEHLIRSGE